MCTLRAYRGAPPPAAPTGYMTEQQICRCSPASAPAHWVSLKSHLTSLNGVCGPSSLDKLEIYEEIYRRSHDSHWRNWNEKPVVLKPCFTWFPPSSQGPSVSLINSSFKCHGHFVIPQSGGSLAQIICPWGVLQSLRKTLFYFLQSKERHKFSYLS